MNFSMSMIHPQLWSHSDLWRVCGCSQHSLLVVALPYSGMGEEEVASVWPRVSRIPTLSRQIETGVSMVAELAGLVSTSAQFRASYGRESAKAVKKKGKQMEKLQKEYTSSMSMALMLFKHTLEEHGAILEEDCRALEESIANGFLELSNRFMKQKQEASLELARQKKALDAKKDAVSRKRRDCLKQWDFMQDLLKKVQELRDAEKKDKAPGEKYKEKIQKAEKAARQHRLVVQNMFKELEVLVEETNEHQRKHITTACTAFLEKMKADDLRRSEETAEMIRKFCAQQKEIAAKIVKSMDMLELYLGNVKIEGDNNMFMISAVPKGLEAPYPELECQLPYHSDSVADVVSRVLDSGEEYLDSLSKVPLRDLKVEEAKTSSKEVSMWGSTYDEKGTEDEEYYEGIRMLALYDHYGIGPDTLEFAAGEYVMVTDQSDPVWWVGYLETDETCTEKWLSKEYVQPT